MKRPVVKAKAIGRALAVFVLSATLFAVLVGLFFPGVDDLGFRWRVGSAVLGLAAVLATAEAILSSR